MASGTTYQALERLTHMPNRDDVPPQGDRIGGQYYDDVYFAGGTAENLLLINPTIVGASTGTVNVLTYGAIGDGTSHPLSEFYPSLEAAQAVYSFADSLTNEIDWCGIQKAINTGSPNVYVPWTAAGGIYLINKYINIPYSLSGRQGIVNIYGDGSYPSLYGSTIRRNVSNAGINIVGTSFSAGQGNQLIKYPRLNTIRIDGGWSQYDTSADYPLINIDSAYEAIWYDVTVTNGISHLILCRELQDSRLHDVRATVGGQHNGYQRSMTMTNLSTGATVSSTTGLFVGQVIFGTGLSRVRISSINSSTSITLSTAANFTGTRTVVFEAKAAVHLCGNDTSTATSNNIEMTGWRLESCPSTALRIQGANGIDYFIDDLKSENAQQSLDYNIDCDGVSGVYLGGSSNWLYAAPTNQSRMEFPFTTSSTTLATILAANMFSFTIPDMFYASNGTMTLGSNIITGITDTATIKIGEQVLGTGSTGLLRGIRVASILDSTRVTMDSNATAAMVGTKALTFRYLYDSGNFNNRMFYSGMSLIVYSTADTRNYALCKMVSYNTTTGETVLDVRNVFGATGTGITAWKIAACHPGLIHYTGSAKLCKGYATGGYQGTADLTSIPYINSLIHIDGINDLNFHFDVTAGFDNFPANSFQTQISTSSNSIGTGAKTFTIATGLPVDMFVANAAVYISENTQSTAQNNMKGTITSYNSGTGALVVNITSIKGSGSLANWNINFAPGTIYCRTGTNTDIIATYCAPTFGAPANFATAIYPIISDITQAGGSVSIPNILYVVNATLFATITKDPLTVYFVGGVGIYYGSTLIAS